MFRSRVRGLQHRGHCRVDRALALRPSNRGVMLERRLRIEMTELGLYDGDVHLSFRCPARQRSAEIVNAQTGYTSRRACPHPRLAIADDMSRLRLGREHPRARVGIL